MNQRYAFWGDLVNKSKSSIHQQIPDLSWIKKDEVIKNLEEDLHNVIEKIALPSFALYLHALKDDNKLSGSTSRKRYQFFVNEYKNRFLSDFPELKQVLKTYLEGLVNCLAGSITKLSEHKEEVFAKFNIDGRAKLHRVDFPNNGDRHLGGRQVLFLEFSSGAKIKYKPVSLQIDRIIKKVAKIINNNLREQVFQFPHGLYYKNCAFFEFLNSDLYINKAQAEQLYYQNGCWLAFVYLLNGIDFHVENVLAQRSQLYLLDTETFFSNFSYSSDRFEENRLVLTGFIERRTKNRPPMSAMFGGNEMYKSITDPFVVNDKTDKLQVKFVKTSNYTPENQPEISGSKPNFAQNKDTVIKGFRDVYKAFEDSEDKIRKIIVSEGQNTTVRQVLRKTSLYALVIQNLYQPHNWPLGEYESEVKEFLMGLNDDLKDVVDIETEDIFNFDIPYFSSRLDDKALYHGDTKLENFFAETPLERWREKMRRMGDRHRKKKSEELERLLSND